MQLKNNRTQHYKKAYPTAIKNKNMFRRFPGRHVIFSSDYITCFPPTFLLACSLVLYKKSPWSKPIRCVLMSRRSPKIWKLTSVPFLSGFFRSIYVAVNWSDGWATRLKLLIRRLFTANNSRNKRSVCRSPCCRHFLLNPLWLRSTFLLSWLFLVYRKYRNTLLFLTPNSETD